MDRYLFVMADFNQDAIAKPVMEQLPPEEKPAAKTDAKVGDAAKPSNPPAPPVGKSSQIGEAHDAAAC